jgi:hypothetical protein
MTGDGAKLKATALDTALAMCGECEQAPSRFAGGGFLFPQSRREFLWIMLK